MECNKEEAVRAMEVAEKKLHDGDYMVARKMAQMAQRLYPELENIKRLLAVIDVHCSAENKISGLEYDWYEILQIQRTADQEAIRKQYRKLALLLHPDKNKFVGAETAFKLIGEANRLLTDQMKRSLYDMKLKASQNTGTHKLNSLSKRPTKKFNEASKSSLDVSQSQSGGINKPLSPTFWTACHFCHVRFQYLKTYVSRMLRCQSCGNVFIAHDLGNQNVPYGSSAARTPTPTPAQNIPSDQVSSKVASKTNNDNANKKSGDKIVEANDTLKTGKISEIASGLKAEQHQKCVNVGMKGSKEGKTSRSGEAKSRGQDGLEDEPQKRKRESGVESDGGDLNGNSDAEVSKSGRRIDVANEENKVDLSRQNSGLIGNRCSRKSPRNKQHYHNKKNCTSDCAREKMPKVSKSSSGNEVEMKDCAGDAVSNANNFSAHTTVDGDCVEFKKKSPTFVQVGLVHKKRKIEEKEVLLVETPVNHNDTKTQMVDCDTISTDGEKINLIEAPQPDFSDFDKDRTENIFAANQMWVVYDTKDSMPRFYCIIKKVLFPRFKLKIIWLEPNPVNKEERDWCNEELPVGCGKFKLGKPQDTSDILMFSHLKNNFLRNSRGSYFIYPRKGETWALFKDWDISWSSATHVLYKYEFVEVLSDFDEVDGIEVAYLCKVTGFVSLFQRSKVSGGHSFKISRNELYRFSHQVPSHVMTGEERDGVPKGSFELDTAGLPLDIFEDDSACDVKSENGVSVSEVSSLPYKSQEKEAAYEKIEVAKEQKRDDSRRGGQVDANPNSNISPRKESATAEKPRAGSKPGVETKSMLRRSPRDLRKKCSIQNVSKEFSDEDLSKSKNFGDSMSLNSSERDSSAKILNNSPSKFPGFKVISTPIHDFNGEKSGKKFQLNQIWAMYNDRDSMPTVYVQVKKIEVNPSLLLHVVFLEPFPQTKDATNQPCLGVFKVKDGKTKAFSPSSFSHCSRAKPIGKDRYVIYPWKGEIWALCKNLNSVLPGKREYDIVEVVEHGDQATTVSILNRLKEYQSVYRSPRIQRSKSGVIDVARHDLARFTHQIPAYRHTGQIDKSLKGCWELDSLALPASLLV